MFDLRVRRFNSDGTRAAVLNTSDLAVTVQESGTARLKFSVSNVVADRLDESFLVGVEYSTGGPYVQPRNGLFIATSEDGDSADASKMASFTAEPFVPWLLDGTHQRHVEYVGARRVENKHEWPDVTPGRVLRSLIDHAKSLNEWAPMLSVDFTPTTDSAGAPWQAAERWSPEFQDMVTVRSIFDAHVNSGLIDWWSEGTKLRVFRPGSGVVLPNVKLGGPGFSRMPAKRSYEGQFSFLTVFCEDGARYYSNPGADLTFGRRDMTATLSGVKLADADKIVQPMLVEGRTPRKELSYEWAPTSGLPVPWVDFQVGDGVKVRDRDGWIDQRVLGITVEKSAAQVITVRATVGSKLLNRLKRAVSQIENGSLGQIQAGTGVTIPNSPPVSGASPMTPDALRVATNTAAWGQDGTARTAVAVAWNAVTQTTDLADVAGVTYELWARRASEASARLVTTDALSFTVEGWEPGVARYLKVRAVDRGGRPSAFSGEISVTPAAPASIVPTPPTGLKIVSNTGAFQQDGTAVSTVTLGWTPVALSVDGKPVTIVEYEVLYGLESMRVRTASATITLPAGKSVQATVRALSDLGVWGDPSVALNVTGTAPAAVTAAPTAPILDTGVSSVTVRWDGQLTTGQPGPGFGFVYMDIASGEAGPWTTIGTPLIRAGGATVRGTMGDTMWVRLRSTDTLGRAGATSAARSIVVVGASGDDIVAGSIQVNHVSPSFGADLDISASESVTILVGAQQQQAGQISDLDQGVRDAQSTAADATAAAGNAQAKANAAGVAATTAQAAANTVGQRLDQHQLYFKVEGDSAKIGRPNGSAELRLAPERIEMTQNTVVVSYWEGGVFVADEARLNSAQIGNHQFMSYGAGRTIVRPL